MVFPCCSLCGVMIKLFLLASIVAFTQSHGKKTFLYMLRYYPIVRSCGQFKRAGVQLICALQFHFIYVFLTPVLDIQENKYAP